MEILTRYVMLGFKLVKKFPYRPSLSLFRVIQALTDALVRIDTGGNVEQSLIGLSILYDGCCLPIHRKYHRAFASLQLLHEVAGTPPESRQRLDVLSNVKHEPAP